MTELTISATWSGAIDVDEGSGVVGEAIRDDAAYAALVARLPERRVQKKQPAPPSTDPLRARPAIDFATHMLVVITRSGTMSPIEIARIEQSERGIVVRYAVTPDTPAARPYEVGTYAAAVVPRRDGVLELLGPRVIEDEREVDAAVGQLVALRGVVVASRRPTLLGVDIDDRDTGGALVEATGWLEREVVTRAELDATLAQVGQFAHRGAGTFYRLVALGGVGLARPYRRY